MSVSASASSAPSATPGGGMIINSATIYIAFSPLALVRGKASACRCSDSTTRADNAVRGQGQAGLPLSINRLGASRKGQLRVPALAKGTILACEPRLDLTFS